MRRKSPHWARYSDAQLLRLRFRDLHLGLPRRAVLQRAIRRLRDELAARDILLEPHFWFSDEWFSPDGVPGIAIPFYLAHPRLERLERRMSSSVEGGNAAGLMRILRHEAGHVVDTAFRLRRRKLWRDTFGSAALPYPTRYVADPSSREFVTHLDGWYAQAHPAEDFAETFAVWLAPRSNWRHRYAGTPALSKLKAMDDLMRSIRGRRPAIRTASRIDPVASNDLSLRDYYRRHLQRRVDCDFSMIDRTLDRGLSKVRPRGPNHHHRRADSCLRALRSDLIRHVMAHSTIDRYGAEQLVQFAVERARERRLWLRGSVRERRVAAERTIRRLAKAALSGETMRFTL
ncbi:MAG: hypothetical protein FJ173_06360 [Gammaproteobacteria bacterium]|nr:hypothetical protein [Gammaproteobacteria bacterium]